MAYDSTKPAGTDSLGSSDELIRENFRALLADMIVNAGYLKGYIPGNATGNIPISNGTLCTNLNAEKLNGQLASYYLNATNINAGTLNIARIPTITAAKGGTGQTVFAVGDILYASTTSALSKLPKGSLGQVLMQGATIPYWATLATTLPLTGGTMQGAINMGAFRITNGADPIDDQDFVTKLFLENSIETATSVSSDDNYKAQCINSFGDSLDTTNIFDVSSADLINNKLLAGIKFNTLIDGLKHRYYLTEDVLIPPMEANKTYYPVLKVKDESKYKRELIADDVEIILLNQPMLWKNSAVSISTKINNVNMSSNTQSGFITSASSSSSTAYEANDGDVGLGSGWVISSNSGCWKIQLPNPQLCNRYVVVTYKSTDGTTAYGPKSWTFEGSNDNTNWTVLDTQSGITGWQLYTGKTFYSKATTKYLYYRINCTAANISGTLGIGEMRLYNDSTVMAVSDNLELQTDGVTVTDKWGNLVTVNGNPTIVGGNLVCDGTGDFIKVSSITTLGTGEWIIQTPIKVNSTTAQMMLMRSKTTYGVQLQKTTANRLSLSLSSNGTTWDIASAVLGTKLDWNTATKYWYRLVSTGTQYLVQWSSDTTNGKDGTWTTDITITSSAKVYGSLAGMLFGAYYDEIQHFLNGSIDIANTKIVVGSTYIQDLGRFSFNGENVFIGYPDAYTSSNAVPAIMLGTLTTNSTQVVDNITYAFNRYFLKQDIVLPSTFGLKQLTQHNLGMKPRAFNCRAIMKNITAENGFIPGDETVYTTYYSNTSSFSTSNLIPDQKYISHIVGGDGILTFNKTTGVANAGAEGNWKLTIEIDED